MPAINLNYTPRKWQRECHTRKKRFTVLALHRRAGKTELAIMELVNSALGFGESLGMFFYVAPFLKQAKLIAWTRLKARLKPLYEAGAVELNEGELTATFKHNGAIIRIYGGDNPDGMRGVRLDGVIIDEVAQIKPEVWIDILQPALADRQGWALFIGTPSGVNLFSELFYKAKKAKDWYSAIYTVYMTDSLKPEEVERLKRDMSEAAFAREFMCDFTAAGDAQLISLADTHVSATKIYQFHDVDYAPRILGVDVARFGDDRSVIFPRQGLQAFKPDVFHGIDNMDLAARVAAKIDSWEPDAVFIDAGNGTGVIDRLKQLGYGNVVIEVHFQGKPNNPIYTNKRAEMWYECREWMRAGGGIPDILELKQELASPMYWYAPGTGKIILEPKEDIKGRGLLSPDLGDALVLTFAHPVVKKVKYRDNVVQGIFKKQQSTYDPYKDLEH